MHRRSAENPDNLSQIGILSVKNIPGGEERSALAAKPPVEVLSDERGRAPDKPCHKHRPLSAGYKPQASG